SVDGCGTPLFAVSLHGLARAAARIATAPRALPGTGSRTRCRRPRGWRRRTGRDTAALMRAVPGLLAKDGFEGVQIAGVDGRAIAVKIAAGRTGREPGGARGGPDAGGRRSPPAGGLRR
ncbi:asparaginase, partial [Kitasatospora aureofaciens]